MITTKTLSGYSIKNGPDRVNLIHAFDHAGDNYFRKPALFEVVENCMTSNGEKFYRAVQVCGVKITGLKYDGDSKYAFVMEGDITVRYLDEVYMDLLDCKFIACYDSVTGKGNAIFLVSN